MLVERLERLERIDGILSALAFPTKNRLPTLIGSEI